MRSVYAKLGWSRDRIHRGDLFKYNFGTNIGSVQSGVRPALVLQPYTQNSNSPTTIIAPITSVIKNPDMSSHVVLGRRFGLNKFSMVLLEQIRTVNQDKLGQYIGHIDDAEIIERINNGLYKTLGL